MQQGVKGCCWLGLDYRGFCKVCEEFGSVYFEGDIDMLEVEMVKFLKFQLLGEWNGDEGIGGVEVIQVSRIIYRIDERIWICGISREILEIVGVSDRFWMLG